MPKLSSTARRRLREVPLADAERAFAAAVAAQLAHPPGHPGDPADEARALERVAALLAAGDGRSGGEAAALLGDPPLLAAAFANLDLLPAGAGARVGALLARLTDLARDDR